MASMIVEPTHMNKDDVYNLIYWPNIPGRGEPIRLALEEAGVTYSDTASSSTDLIRSEMSGKNMGDTFNPPIFAPPVLRHGGLTINQLPNILFYLGQLHGLAPQIGDKDGHGAYHVNELALTALDGLSNEVHETHHPIAVGLYYEDQEEEAKKRAKDYRENRLPKFLGYFEKVLKGEASGDGPWLYGGMLTYADLVLFQTLDGVKFAFPKAVKTLHDSGNYNRVFILYDAVKKRPKIKQYLESDRRQAYSNGIYRYYPELDDE
ncbi:hypothetical protein FALCPG4_018152 [Fusarium falciforme]